jgi:GNAT superfamily N-acetyltransferase
MPKRVSSSAKQWRIVPVTPARWSDLERLFGPRGACAGCWCMFMRLTAAEYKANSSEGRRRALRALVERKPPGLIAYEDGEPVGWIAVAPREQYRRLETSRVFAPVPGERVWSAPCFYVKAGHRGGGLSRALLEAAAAFAERKGAAALEGYPNQNSEQRQAAAFVWTGFESTFQRAGFTEIARRSPKRPILRRTFAGRGRTAPAKRRARAVPSARRARPTAGVKQRPRARTARSRAHG